MRFNTCRLCGEFGLARELVRYGARHYAHFECYLKSDKPLSDLPEHELGSVPYSLLKKHGKLDEALAIRGQTAARKASITTLSD